MPFDEVNIGTDWNLPLDDVKLGTGLDNAEVVIGWYVPFAVVATAGPQLTASHSALLFVTVARLRGIVKADQKLDNLLQHDS